MPKIPLDDLSSLANETSAIALINNNNAAIEEGFNNTLSRDGTSPNTMEAQLDMNQNRLVNVPNIPTSNNEAASKYYVDYIAGLTADTTPTNPSDAIIEGSLTVGGDLTLNGSFIGDLSPTGDIFLASGGIIDWNSGEVTITHSTNSLSILSTGSNTLNINNSTGNSSIEIGRVDGSTSTPFIDFHSGATAVDYDSRLIASGGTGSSAGGTLSFDGAIFQSSSNNLASLGQSGTAWSDLFLASGGVINFNAGDVTFTHAADALNLAFDGTDKVLMAKTQTINSNVFNLSSETDIKSSIVFRGSDAGSHNSQLNNFITVEHRPVGSGTNGSGSADYGVVVSIAKNDFTAVTPTVGEIDALSLAVRQGGTASDCAAILGNVAHTGTGFAAFTESVTSLIPGPTFAATQTVRTQAGVIDNVTPNSFGYFVSADLGTIGEAFRAGTNGGQFTWLFRGQNSGTNVFTVDGTGGIASYRDNTSTNPMCTFEQDGTGDAVIQWLLTGTKAWIAGIDNSDGDAFKIGGANDGFATNVFFTINSTGSIITSPPSTPPTLGTNGQLTFNPTSNTNLRFSFRGSDGTTRVANLTLA